MKIHIPAFEPLARCNEHLRHGPIEIDLGEDVVQVVRCKNCHKYDLETQCCKFWPDEGYRAPDHYCAEGERRDGNG